MARLNQFLRLALGLLFAWLAGRPAPAAPASAAPVYATERFDRAQLEGWTAFGRPPVIAPRHGNPALQTHGDAQLFWGAPEDASKKFQEVTLEGDVSVERVDVNSGFILRASRPAPGNACGGYFASIRLLAAGYAIVQLHRLPHFELLQEARVIGTVKPDEPIRLKASAQGPFLRVWANDLSAPAITEFDDTWPAAGFVGLKAVNNKAWFDNVVISAAAEALPKPVVRDWSWVKGAVFITSDRVNSYQMWEEYHPDTIDRELFYARFYGLNTVQVYLNFLCWQKLGPTYLDRLEDFLQRADRHQLKVTFILFDDVGNVEPPHLAPYPPPVPGIHNSQMMGSPGRAIVDQQYTAHRDQLKAYVQAVVNAHKTDPRILFWQTYNEPSHATTLPLLKDSYQWIKETGCQIPVSATGGGAFYGSYYSDFPTYHSYLAPDAPAAQGMVLGDGGPEHLCTETLDRPGVDMPKLVNYFAARTNGWIVWELMIGRDNCRFPWGSKKGAPEPAVPFHGLIYPDGHPWAVDDIKLLRGGDLTTLPVFEVQYFGDPDFKTLKKTSIVPRLDFELNAEPGTAASDASAGIGDTRWANRYRGTVTAPQTGTHTFFADSDGQVRVWLDGRQILNKPSLNARQEVEGRARLEAGKPHPLLVEYVHDTGPAVLHLKWSGPGLEKQAVFAAPSSASSRPGR